MSEWVDTELDEYIEYVNRGIAPRYAEGDGITVLNQKCIRNGYINFSFSRLHNLNKSYAKKKKIIKNDILINSTGVGTAGRVALFDKEIDVLVDSHISILRLNKNCLYPLFIYYNLRGREKEIEEIAEGSTGQIELKREAIRKLKIKIPKEVEEQKAIAAVLSSLDDKIDLLHRQNKTLESIAETLFRQWFIEEAQDDWEEVRLSCITDIAIGRTPPRKEFHWFSKNNKDIKWISIKDLGDYGAYVLNTSEYLTAEAIVKFRIPVIPKDTVVLSFKMTVGRVGITSEDMLSNEAIAHFRIKDESIICKEFIYFYLKSFKYETLGSTSSIVTSINSTIIKELTISLPDKESMQKFKRKAEEIFNKIKHNQTQIKTLERLRDNLLPKLMSGDVRVEYEVEA